MPLISGAHFSSCRTYRYVLWRRWDENAPSLLFIGLNPSAADEHTDDPTIRRCLDFARRWGYGSMYVANLFAFCTHDPRELKQAADPVGPENERYLREYIHHTDRSVLIWGNHGSFLGRDREVLPLVPDPWCIKITAQGQPGHPLYLRKDMQPIPFTPLPSSDDSRSSDE